jgi:hypothetical protein
MGVKLGVLHKGKNKLRLFEKRLLRKIFGPKRDEVAGGRTRLHNVKLHNFFASPNIIRVINGRDEKYRHNFGWKA